MGRDISERREAQRAIQQAMAELEAANEELKSTQTKLVQSEKMASLGLLVAGIAHEINTPVGAISSMHDTLVRAVDKLKASLLECRISEQDASRVKPIIDVIDDANRVIREGTERVTTIVRRLRSFARLDEAELKEVDIHEGIEDTLTLIHHEIKNRIEIVREFGDIPRVTVYPGRLNQVFLNLLNNARQAIAGQGTIWISTAIRDNRLEIRFRDSGKGIKPDHLAKVFDPGFTTKGAGIGTGLGLSICYQIIEDHRGEIKVESELGQGTTFIVRIPLDLGNNEGKAG
jgi:two-component system NtrC family sensor kinase